MSRLFVGKCLSCSPRPYGLDAHPMRELVFQARMPHQAMAMGVFSAMSSFRQILLTTSSTFGMMFVAKDLSLEHTKTNFSRFTNRSRFQTSQLAPERFDLYRSDDLCKIYNNKLFIVCQGNLRGVVAPRFLFDTTTVPVLQAGNLPGECEAPLR